MEKKPLIIRCSDGWIYGLFGYYEEAVEVAEQHVDGTITRGKNKEIREEIKKNEDATIPVGALVFQEDDEH